MSSDGKRAAAKPKRVGVVGLGQCGGNLATIFAAHGYPAAALNVSFTDLATHAMSGDAKFILGEDVSSWGGPIAEAARSLGQVDLVLAVGGLGGSVGGSLGELVRKLDGVGTSVVAVGVLPAKSDSFGAKRTALAAINDLLEGPFESLVLVDNQKLHALHSGLGVDRYLPACNGAVFDAIARLESAGDTPGLVALRSFEQRAMQSALSGGGVAVFGEMEIDLPLTHEALLHACFEILNNNPVLASEHELEDIVALGSVVIASEEVLEQTPISVFDLYHAETHLVTGGITHDVGIYRGGSEKPRLQVIASGLGLPSSVQRMLNELGEDARRVQAKKTSVRAKLKPLDLTSLPEIDGGVGPRSVRKPGTQPQHTLYTRPTPMRPPKPESTARVEGPQTERGASLTAVATPAPSVDGAALRQALLRHQALAQPLTPAPAPRRVASVPPPLPRSAPPPASLPSPPPRSAPPPESLPSPPSAPPERAASQAEGTSAAASDRGAANAPSATVKRDERGDVARDRESAPDVAAFAADAVIEELTDDEVAELDALNDADGEALPPQSQPQSQPQGPDEPAAQAAVASLVDAENEASHAVAAAPASEPEGAATGLASAPLEATPISPSVEAIAPRRSAPPVAPPAKSDAPHAAASSLDDADATGRLEALSTKAGSAVTISESAAVDGRMRIVVELDPEDDLGVAAD